MESKINSRAMEEGFELANKAYIGFMKGTGVTDTKVNVAMKYISSAARLKATEANEKQMTFAVLKNIAADQKEFREYIRLSNPDMIPKKALKGK